MLKWLLKVHGHQRQSLGGTTGYLTRWYPLRGKLTKSPAGAHQYVRKMALATVPDAHDPMFATHS
jgi:catalase (peroxidase I)